MKEITIHTDKEKLHMKFIHDFISNSYCAKGRTPEKMKQSIENSLNFGVYVDGEQIGYARVVSDFTIFAYLMDVFIIEKSEVKAILKN